MNPEETKDTPVDEAGEPPRHPLRRRASARAPLRTSPSETTLLSLRRRGPLGPTDESPVEDLSDTNRKRRRVRDENCSFRCGVPFHTHPLRSPFTPFLLVDHGLLPEPPPLTPHLDPEQRFTGLRGGLGGGDPKFNVDPTPGSLRRVCKRHVYTQCDKLAPVTNVSGMTPH